jgi:hypothetical protein
MCSARVTLTPIVREGWHHRPLAAESPSR